MVVEVGVGVESDAGVGADNSLVEAVVVDTVVYSSDPCPNTRAKWILLNVVAVGSYTLTLLMYFFHDSFCDHTVLHIALNKCSICNKMVISSQGTLSASATALINFACVLASGGTSDKNLSYACFNFSDDIVSGWSIGNNLPVSVCVSEREVSESV